MENCFIRTAVASADLDPASRSVRSKAARKRDGLDQVGRLAHRIGSRSEHFSGDKDFWLEIVFGNIWLGGIGQRNGDVDISVLVVALQPGFQNSFSSGVSIRLP